jgi:hypothetical protein
MMESATFTATRSRESRPLNKASIAHDGRRPAQIDTACSVMAIGETVPRTHGILRARRRHVGCVWLGGRSRLRTADVRFGGGPSGTERTAESRRRHFRLFFLIVGDTSDLAPCLGSWHKPMKREIAGKQISERQKPQLNRFKVI